MSMPVDPISVIRYLQTRIGELELDKATLSAHCDTLRSTLIAVTDKADQLDSQVATMNEQNAMLSKRLEENGIAP